jgi:formate hydrogenlyase subunit 3/multisubunit Na+/H+ antiporter MnhD subunit
MKSIVAVRYPQPLSIVVSDFARVSPRHGVAAYGSSVVLALVTLVGSSFFRELRRTFGQHVFGVRVLAVWETAFCVLAVAWLASIVVGVLCLSHRGRTRSLGAYSVAINISTALLVLCTML